MANFFSKYKFIIIGAAAIIAVFVVYGIMKPAPEGDGTIETTVVGSDSGREVGANGLGGSGDIGEEFVLQLLAIQNIHFDTDFFKDPVYRALIDQFRPIESRPVGRPNPFYPIGQDDGPAGTVATPDVAQVTAATSTTKAATTSSSTKAAPRR